MNMSGHELSTLPGKTVKTMIRATFAPKWFFRQRAAINFPPKFPLKVKCIIDNQRERYFNILKPVT